MSATEACRDYEYWASEVDRLTDEIRTNACPRAAVDAEICADMDNPEWWHYETSCFGRAKAAQMPRNAPDDDPRPTLDEIAAAVAECPGCSCLCDLIRGRMHARQRLGVAKRSVRAAGKRALR